MHGTVRGLFKILGALAMLAFFAGAWAIHRISEGPLSLSPLTPYIEQALTQQSPGITVQIKDTILTWSGQPRALEIRALGVHLKDDKGGSIASLPEMTVTLLGRGLLRGRLVARSIHLLHPALRLKRDDSGAISLGIGATVDAAGDGSGERAATPEAEPETTEPGSGLAAAAFAALLAPPGGETLAGQLQSIEVVGGALVIEDQQRGLRWTAPEANLKFSRDHLGIKLSAHLTLELDGQPGHLDIDGLYRQADRQLDLTLAGAGIRPAALARLSPQLASLAAAQVALSGKVTLSYRLGTAPGDGLVALNADLASGAGVIDLTGPAGFSAPVKSMILQLDLKDDHLTLRQGRIDLGGGVLIADGTLDGQAGGFRAALTLRMQDIALDQLALLWPAGLAVKPRAWITANLTQGRIDSVEASLIGHLPQGQRLDALVIDSLQGEMKVSDATVRYVPAMPKILHVAADAHFDANQFDIALVGGTVGGLTLGQGRVLLEGLSAVDQDALISLGISASLPDILRFIDHPPLGWTSKFGIDADQVSGDAQLALRMAFPLVESLTLEQLKTTVVADTRGVFLPHVLHDIDLVDGALHITVDNDGLDAVGPAQIDGNPATVAWRENFSAASFVSRYEVAAQLSDEGRRQAGLDAAPLQPPYVSGVIPLTVLALKPRSGRTDVSVTADLTPALLTLPGLNYVKPPGLPANGTAELHLLNDRLGEQLHFRLAGANHLDVDGQLDFVDGLPTRLLLPRANWARSTLAGRVDFLEGDQGLRLELSGASFDGRQFLSDSASDPVTDRAAKPAPRRTEAHDHSHAAVTPLAISGHFDRVWLSDDGALAAVVADLTRDHRDWRQARIKAEVGDHHNFTLSLQPRDVSHSDLRVDSNDGGALLQAMDVFTTLRGGALTLSADYDEEDPARPLAGDLQISEFQLVQAPVLAKLLTVAGLTGIGDLLSGQGIHFARLQMPFGYQDGVLQVHDGEAAGSALGITAKGRVDLDHAMLALEGTLVPAYAVNSALGGLPLIGGIFSAEKGGGVLAINYQMKGPINDPSFTVNPLSALTPGFLRGLFGIFDSDPPLIKPKN